MITLSLLAILTATPESLNTCDIIRMYSETVITHIRAGQPVEDLIMVSVHPVQDIIIADAVRFNNQYSIDDFKSYEYNRCIKSLGDKQL